MTWNVAGRDTSVEPNINASGDLSPAAADAEKDISSNTPGGITE